MHYYLHSLLIHLLKSFKVYICLQLVSNQQCRNTPIVVLLKKERSFQAVSLALINNQGVVSFFFYPPLIFFYSCFTILCYFLLYSKVNQDYVHIHCIFFFSFSIYIFIEGQLFYTMLLFSSNLSPISCPTPPYQIDSEHLFQFPEPYSKFQFAIILDMVM